MIGRPTSPTMAMGARPEPVMTAEMARSHFGAYPVRTAEPPHGAANEPEGSSSGAFTLAIAAWVGAGSMASRPIPLSVVSAEPGSDVPTCPPALSFGAGSGGPGWTVAIVHYTSNVCQALQTGGNVSVWKSFERAWLQPCRKCCRRLPCCHSRSEVPGELVRWGCKGICIIVIPARESAFVSPADPLPGRGRSAEWRNPRILLLHREAKLISRHSYLP